jgi:formate-dependent nitrite reductase membrane component NrfD
MDDVTDFLTGVAARLVEIAGHFWLLGWRKCLVVALLVAGLTVLVLGLVQKVGMIRQH